MKKSEEILYNVWDIIKKEKEKPMPKSLEF